MQHSCVVPLVTPPPPSLTTMQHCHHYCMLPLEILFYSSYSVHAAAEYVQMCEAFLFPGRSCLQFLKFARTEGGGLGDLVTCVTSGRQRVDRWGVVPNCCNYKHCIDQPQVYRTTSCIDAVFPTLQSQVLGQDTTRRTSRFFVGHRPPSVYLSLRHIPCTT